MIHTRKENGIGFLTLANPAKRNALSPELLSSMHTAVEQFNADKDIRVIVIEAEGKVFCAGADLRYLQEIRNRDGDENLEDSKHMMKCFRAIYESPKVVIAKVQGDAIAGGCGLITICDYVIASDNARFGFTEVAIGFVPAIVGVFLVRKIGEARSRHILLKAHVFNAQEAKSYGLVYDIVTPEELNDRVLALATEMAAHPATSIQLTKNLLVHVNDMDVISGLDYAATVNALSRQTADFRQGIDTILSRISGDKK